MERFVHLSIYFFVVIPSSIYSSNLTFVFTHLPSTNLSALLQSNGLAILNSASVQRLSTLNGDLINSTQKLITTSSFQSIVFSWNTGDCSLPTSWASFYSSNTIVNPLCLTSVTSLTNQYQLLVTSAQLADAAGIFMTRYSLHYFSIIVTDSSNFHFSLTQQFASYMSEASFIYERMISASSFSASSVTSLKSRGQCAERSAPSSLHAFFFF